MLKTGAVPRILPMLAALLLLAGCEAETPQSSSDQNQDSPPRKAQVMAMERRDINLDKSYSAKLRSEQEAIVIARVQGLLEQRHFEPGQRVDKGDSLYTIEPDVYKATVSQREADVQSAQAEASRAQRDAKRFERLQAQNSVSQQDYDQAVAERRIAQAKVAQAQAALQSAKIDLGYTNVTAPVAGMISLGDVNVGNVVSSGTELATITPMDPLEVRFQLPQNDAFDLRRQRQRQSAPITAVLEFPGLAGSDASTLEGRLEFLGSSVEANTSTVQAQAIFDNPDNMYLPGQFVRVRLKGMKRYDVFAVPEIAVTQGLMGPQVFTVNDKNAVTTSNVTIGETAGARLIISDGLAVGDRVIASDPGGIEAGIDINPQPYDGNAQRISAQGSQSQNQSNSQASEGQSADSGDGAAATAEGDGQ